MKFAKELDENAVAEWRDKYLDYKGGKKKLKAVTRAMRNVDDGKGEGKQRPSPFASLRDAPVYSMFEREQQAVNGQANSRDSNTPLVHARSRSEAPSPVFSANATPKPRQIDERSPLKPEGKKDGPKLTRYGSIIGTPPDEESPAMVALRQAPSLELPEPAVPDEAVDDEYDRPVSPGSPKTIANENVPRPPPTQLAHTGNAYEVSKPTDAPPSAVSSKRFQSVFQPMRSNSTPDGNRPFMRRMFSIATPGGTGAPRNNDVALEAYREVDFRKAEFFFFLDKELDKIESFYKQKEEDAQARLEVLREQLHVLRDRRLEEVVALQQRHRQNGSKQSLAQQNGGQFGGQVGWGHLPVPDGKSKDNDAGDDASAKYRRSHPFKASMEVTRDALEKVRTGHVGKTSKAMGELGTPARALGMSGIRGHDPTTDYSRKPTHGVPYRTAKRKLKIAMAEFYRGLELLKSYALLNRTAFRKINKKYDKAVNAHPKLRYMSEKVNKAHFVQSTTPDDLISTVEDLYARYFERGNHKIAVGKLRAKVAKAGDYTAPVFRTGLLFAAGTVFAIQGTTYGFLRLYDADAPPERATQTSYLLQIYAGYFMMLLLVGLFCVDAAIFAFFKVNYQFIFEFDTRHNLDWKQLAEMPSYFWFLLGFIMWCNFSSFGTSGGMYIYWPVILVGLAVILLCCPPSLFYPRSRGWFLVSNYRLLLAGIFPVEFRDFFLGDMYCSQTYALGNIELFFCLYAHHWSNPPQCNSSHSMLLGFFTTLPGILRLFQCFRRYHDTRLWTHLANGAKYTCTILQYLSLSVWRIYGGYHLLAFFIACACLNSFYCSFWDLNYDWSMTLNPYAKPYPLLRPLLAYRKRVWWYYAAIVLDPILRFNWIFYVIFRNDIQHSSLVSFFVGFSEIIRRGIWVLFRVENEHCTNVGRYRAQRDPALPYEIKPPQQEQEAEVEAEARAHGTTPEDTVLPSDTSSTAATGRDLEAGPTPQSTLGRTPSSLRQRRQAVVESPVYAALKRVGSTLRTAHAQDYERKKPAKDEHEGTIKDDDEDDDEDSDAD